MSEEFELYLGHILESIEEIEKYIKGLDKAAFKKNREKQDAIMRRLEIIGEAVKNLPSSFRDTYLYIPWQDIAGMRDILIHEYFGVDLDLVWKAVKKDMPKLKRDIQEILDGK